ncbi:hypothetical protein J2Z21_007265 [Streptomyces griseochromogenes]|uniref:Transposase Helix-turn-helix domain-containing protein n=1 Tax=Streptomyces griseochromogenes TaxID=68214 RepID=A0A1B1AYI5_9ACTN|nr:transposase family protein [Streptomyces griseochromogenes]ANP51634.1 hypothetical protein AVL59_20340 [Streptomyces griseochromogenes]MBP2054262.1 hypothetical protein [Streptomyces griseochromogenes]
MVSLRHDITHDVLACWFGVDRSTIPRAIGEVRPLIAQRIILTDAEGRVLFCSPVRPGSCAD